MFQIFGAETRKTRELKLRLCRRKMGTEVFLMYYTVFPLFDLHENSHIFLCHILYPFGFCF